MKKLILASLLLVATVASADILHPANLTTRNVTGDAAKHMYHSIAGDVIPGDTLRGYSSSYRVERAPNGLKQTVCEKIISRNEGTTYRCTIQVSNDEQPVPVFNAPSRRLG